MDSIPENKNIYLSKIIEKLIADLNNRGNKQ